MGSFGVPFPKSAYTTGSTNIVSRVALTSPPITTVASGRCDHRFPTAFLRVVQYPT